MAAEYFDLALSKGVVGLVSRLYSEGVHPFQIIQDIRHAYKGMNMGEVGQAYWLGVQAYSAAQMISGVGGQGLAALADIPVNSQLFGGQSIGNQFRFQTLIQFNIPGEAVSRYATVNVLSPNNLSLADLKAIADIRFSQLVSGGGRYFDKANKLGGVVTGVSILNAERQF